MTVNWIQQFVSVKIGTLFFAYEKLPSILDVINLLSVVTREVKKCSLYVIKYLASIITFT